jgi:wyosine [tRNA(Phe)-imidazoG37] synthetase (radical SAM superfamily)
MDAGGFRYIFGPVLSGRLGRSLGLDLLGRRVCSMNCVYCESGRLETLTLTRAPYVPAAELLGELDAWDKARRDRGEPLPDAATLGGLGEPTLNSDMPEIIEGIRRILPGVPVAVLTNATLMTDPAVRAELARVDMVLPSLDSLVPEEFLAVNRGYPGLDPKAIADGVLEFSRGYEGRLYLEILLAAGINDSERNLELLAGYCKRLQPDRVDVVTLSRPGTESFALPVDAAQLARWRERLCRLARPGTGLAGTPEKGHIQTGAFRPEELETHVLASLVRRPQTAAQLAAALLAPEGQVRGVLAQLVEHGRLQAGPGEPVYYRPVQA